MRGHSEAVAIGKPEHGLSPGIQSDSTRILDLQSPEMWEINVCCLSHSVCGILLNQPKLTKTCALSHPPFPSAIPYLPVLGNFLSEARSPCLCEELETLGNYTLREQCLFLNTPLPRFLGVITPKYFTWTVRVSPRE